MVSGRLQAVTHGLMAVALTSTVAQLQPPHQASFEAPRGQWPVALSCIFSFACVGLYWTDHQHSLQAGGAVNGRVVRANPVRLAGLLYVVVAAVWLIPDRRFEKVVSR